MSNIKQLLKEELILIDKRSLLNEFSLSLIENPEYVKHVLGINVPINETNSFEIKKQIIEAQFSLQGILNSANEKLGQAIVKGKEKAVVIVNSVKTVKDLVTLFKDLILSPQYLGIANNTLSRTCINLGNYLTSMVTKLTALVNNEAVTNAFNKLIEHINNVFDNLATLTGWTGFLAKLGFSTLITYLKENVFDKIQSLGAKFFKDNPDLVSGVSKMLNLFKEFKTTLINSVNLNGILGWFDKITANPVFQGIQMTTDILVSLNTVIQPIIKNINWLTKTPLAPELTKT